MKFTAALFIMQKKYIKVKNRNNRRIAKSIMEYSHEKYYAEDVQDMPLQEKVAE